MSWTPCFAPSTMVIYMGEQRIPACTKHGAMYSEDTNIPYSLLRPSDPPGRCYFLVRAALAEKEPGQPQAGEDK